MARWQERISRSIVKSLMRFPSVADALFELIDNPIDYRRGRRLRVVVSVQKDKDTIVVEDHGGEGMDADGIEDWLNWGSGHPHEETDIGLYHQGGKAACGYLANSLVLYAKRAGSAEVWRLADDDWVERQELRDWGEPEPIDLNSPALPPSVRGKSAEEGFVRIQLSRLRPKYFNLDDLHFRLSSCYRCLLQDGDVAISLNGSQVLPLQLPLSSAFKPDPQELGYKAEGSDSVRRDGNRLKFSLRTESGYKLWGWVGRLDRDAITGVSARRRMPGGMRCLFQKRLISPGEYFGHFAEGKGILASLIGEVNIDPRIKPDPRKTGFDRDSLEWREVERTMHDLLAPVVALFRRAGEGKPASREERKRLSQVCDEVAEAARRLQHDAVFSRGGHVPAEPEPGPVAVAEPVVGPGGRRPPRPPDGQPREPSESPRDRGEVTERTEPPEDAVGRLLRRLTKIAGGSAKPPAVLEPIDQSERAAWEDGRTKLVVNTAYPLYEELKGAHAYLAETIILKLAEPEKGQPKSLDDYLAEVNNLLLAWASVHRERAV